jgi:hypothetical protein
VFKDRKVYKERKVFRGHKVRKELKESKEQLVFLLVWSSLWIPRVVLIRKMVL